MSQRQVIVVYCYDVAEDRLRTRVSRVLEKRLSRVQFSVYEGRLSLDEANALFDLAVREIGLEDTLRMYVLSPSSLGQCRASGGAPLPEDGPYWIV